MVREKAKELCAEKVTAFNHCCKETGFLMVVIYWLNLSPSIHLVSAFNHCCKETGFLMVFKCRDQNAALKECLTVHYRDSALFEECKQEYIKEKLEYQRTGVAAKNRSQKLPTSM
ncbi:COX assembly mitochondrial protein homolog isoform X2 [Oncorhynchus mykiss]|nr:COX assembly mitochondrial protein homolog isoform X2 [Oncorhynchus mykiss]